MKVLVLSSYPERIKYALRQEGDDAIVFTGPPDQWPNEDFDFIVSYGYRHIVRGPLLSRLGSRMANLHISYLPWNRGSNPNFWSWYCDTPKGVTLHFVDEGIDTGPIIARMEANDFSPNSTHDSSYNHLHFLAGLLFLQTWPRLRRGECIPLENDWKNSGSVQTQRDLADVLGGARIDPQMLVSEIKRMGCEARKSASDLARTSIDE
jgi:methionyl-tRNA formyltransferase